MRLEHTMDAHHAWMLETREFWTRRLDALEAALRAEDAIEAARKSPQRRKK